MSHASQNHEDRWGFKQFVEASVNEGFLRPPVLMQGMSGPRISREGQPYINFSGINYLGWQQDPQVLEAFCDSVRAYGLSTGGSRATQGVCEPHDRLERLLSLHHGKEKTLSFASGMLANIGFINAITARFAFSPNSGIDNRDTVLVFDRDCHWSLWKAAAHLKFGEQLLAFKHNNVADLERVLGGLAGKKVVVVFESLYSSDGSVAPIGPILDVCERFGALSYIDDANGFMVYGPEHRPFHAEFSQLRRADFIMVSLSKAVGLEGGAISAKADYIDAFEVLSGTSIFTAAIQPPTADAAADIIQRLLDEPRIMDDYLLRCQQLRQRLLKEGLRLNPHPSYITSVMIGNDARAEQARVALESEGFCVPIFRYPAVKPNQALVRLIMHRGHTDQDIERFATCLGGQLRDVPQTPAADQESASSLEPVLV
ncbi:pyridoxal phosphate-dependent aminotransferase family protein [Roseateles sp. DAIF2]|uniref:aminotransferase class I/II-fold pyridoxal phosphate-dependent enzyme n=1 Tax=Roseateles sp. DAIF2 TaxID=2714952 RepID=UPI0018A30931|nr:pyridoxal phosphate-dependent aminotransferase family protein [Roseateles sp. DAIF2]QPF73201.1 pyridoxal phosphate-dependent aminotransferase family protein [Roseateles sp. DAIF2]